MWTRKSFVTVLAVASVVLVCLIVNLGMGNDHSMIVVVSEYGLMDQNYIDVPIEPSNSKSVEAGKRDDLRRTDVHFEEDVH